VTGEFKTTKGSVSFVNIRFVKDGVGIPRLNFVGSDNGTAFACVHSMENTPADNSKLILNITKSGPLGTLLSLIGLGSLGGATYSGTIPGAIYALTAPIAKTSGAYQVTAKIYQNNVLLDSVTEHYGTQSDVQDWVVICVVAIVLIGLVVAAVIFFRKRMNKHT
jgi:hypothetical protein